MNPFLLIDPRQLWGLLRLRWHLLLQILLGLVQPILPLLLKLLSLWCLKRPLLGSILPSLWSESNLLLVLFSYLPYLYRTYQSIRCWIIQLFERYCITPTPYFFPVYSRLLVDDSLRSTERLDLRGAPSTTEFPRGSWILYYLSYSFSFITNSQTFKDIKHIPQRLVIKG